MNYGGERERDTKDDGKIPRAWGCSLGEDGARKKKND